MAACWRALAAQAVPPRGEPLEFIVLLAEPAVGSFDPALLQGLPIHLLDWKGILDGGAADEVRHRLDAFRPDLISLPGWRMKAYRPLATRPLDHLPRLAMTMDNPWLGTPRQTLGSRLVRRFVGRFDGVLVPGERAFQYARRLGVPPDRIFRGLYGCDFGGLRSCLALRAAGSNGWPRSFVFVGRYVEDKGLDVLVEAYRRYRSRVTHPWDLVCCGQGPLGRLLANPEGIFDHGFIQPADQPALWSRCGAMVLASRYDPWPLVVLEACAAGLPVVCTDACGSAVELIRPHYNGFLCASGDVDSLTRAMVRTHRAGESGTLGEMGRRSQALAEPYAADLWAERFVATASELLERPRRSERP